MNKLIKNYLIIFGISVGIFLLTNFIPHGYYSVSNLGEYYSLGVPFAHTQMLGDAPLYKKEFLLINFLIINMCVTFVFRIINFFK